MPTEVKTGGLKKFVHDKNKPVYSSREEENFYSGLGEESKRLIMEKRKRKRLMRVMLVVLGLVVLGVLVGFWLL